jgi:hypothetical protein
MATTNKPSGGEACTDSKPASLAVNYQAVSLTTTAKAITVCGTGEGSPGTVTFTDVEVVASLSHSGDGAKVVSVVDEAGLCTSTGVPDADDGAGIYKFSCDVTAWGENTVTFKATTNKATDGEPCIDSKPVTLTVNPSSIAISPASQRFKCDYNNVPYTFSLPVTVGTVPSALATTAVLVSDDPRCTKTPAISADGATHTFTCSGTFTGVTTIWFNATTSTGMQLFQCVLLGRS